MGHYVLLAVAVEVADSERGPAHLERVFARFEGAGASSEQDRTPHDQILLAVVVEVAGGDRRAAGRDLGRGSEGAIASAEQKRCPVPAKSVVVADDYILLAVAIEVSYGNRLGKKGASE